MEYVQPVIDWWNGYYPLIVSVGGAILGVVSGVTFVYLKFVKPLIDKVTSLKQTVEDKSNTLSPLELIKTNTMITDLKHKLENPTISDSLKLQYKDQLYQLEKIVDTANSGLDKVEETTNKYL